MSDEMRPRPEFAEALGDWFVEAMSEHRARSVPSRSAALERELEATIAGEAPEPGRRPRIAGAVAAAAAAAVLVVGLAAIGTRVAEEPVPVDEPTPPPTASPAPVTTAGDRSLVIGEALMGAMNDRDTTEAGELLAGDAAVSALSARDTDEFLELIEYFDTEGAQFGIDSCEPGRSYQTTCTATFTNDWSAAVDADPITAKFHFNVDDGRIVVLIYELDFDVFGPQVWEPWIAFLEDRHPDDIDTMLVANPSGLGYIGPHLTDESNRLHRAHTAEFVALHTTD